MGFATGGKTFFLWGGCMMASSFYFFFFFAVIKIFVFSLFIVFSPDAC
jgi:hypothetical protein